MTFVLLVIIAVLAACLGYVVGTRGRAPRGIPPAPPAPAAIGGGADGPSASVHPGALHESEASRRDAESATHDTAALEPLPELVREREQLFRELADARGESARYRQIVIDIENNAPPPILAGVGEPDDLKLIVGVGPVLERMLHNLGVTTFRQIARWTEREIADFDAKLPEFPGRIQRDQWVTQARALHESKYGQDVPGLRGPG
jgi:predicted flap endonuclease-1-like 5' DNA nuclease